MYAFQDLSREHVSNFSYQQPTKNNLKKLLLFKIDFGFLHSRPETICSLKNDKFNKLKFMCVNAKGLIINYKVKLNASSLIAL